MRKDTEYKDHLNAGGIYDSPSPLVPKFDDGLQDASLSSPYALVANGTMVSGLNKAIAGKRLEDVSNEFNPDIFSRNPTSGFSVAFKSVAQGKLTTPTKLFLKCLYVKFEDAGRPKEFYIPMPDFQKMRGNISRKSAWEQAKKAVDALTGSVISYKEKTIKDAKEHNFENVSIFDTIGIVNGRIHVKFGDTFYSNLRVYPTLPLPKQLLAINGKLHAYAVSMSELIEEHRKNTPKEKGDTRNILTVEYLLKEAGFPSPDSVDRHYKEKIIQPFEKNLDALEYLTWEYLDKNNNPLKKGGSISWEVFTLAKIRTQLKIDPEEFRLDGRPSDIEGDGRVL